MFEKEAEYYAFDEVKHKQEWYIKHPEHSIDYDYEDIKKHWEKGAEFGYNKYKEELNQIGLALQSDMNKTIEQNIALKKELEKGNEWHYPSKGELPKCDEETQLIFYVNYYYNLGDEIVTKKRMVLGYYKKSFLRDDVKLFVEKSRGYEDEHLPQAVIAWKEIILPKEIKENE